MRIDHELHEQFPGLGEVFVQPASRKDREVAASGSRSATAGAMAEE